MVEIGSKNIEFKYDWGNYFIVEWLDLYSNKTKIASATREYGAVDPEKKSAENKEAGEKFLGDLAKDLLIVQFHHFLLLCLLKKLLFIKILKEFQKINLFANLVVEKQKLKQCETIKQNNTDNFAFKLINTIFTKQLLQINIQKAVQRIFNLKLTHVI